MSLYRSVLRPLLFRMDPEDAHNLALGAIKRGWIKAPAVVAPELSQTLFGLDFPNPIGLAAGFDKSAEAASEWHKLGFGYAELGTVTFHEQPGNPQPRLFRLPEDRALINRFGFNNAGASMAAVSLARARPKIPIGINLGKSKITPVDRAADDYVLSFRLLKDRGDYFVVNVSSPNTPGLRSLQERGPLTEIVSRLREIDPEKPLFVKVSPDLSVPALDDVIAVCHEHDLTGIVATNTTTGREGLSLYTDERGGLSGRPLRALSDEMLAHLYRSCDRRMTLIGVGGIGDLADLVQKIRLGASLCQVYTGWVYSGPEFVPKLAQGLLDFLREEKVSLSELRGSANPSH